MSRVQTRESSLVAEHLFCQVEAQASHFLKIRLNSTLESRVITKHHFDFRSIAQCLSRPQTDPARRHPRAHAAWKPPLAVGRRALSSPAEGRRTRCAVGGRGKSAPPTDLKVSRTRTARVSWGAGLLSLQQQQQQQQQQQRRRQLRRQQQHRRRRLQCQHRLRRWPWRRRRARHRLWPCGEWRRRAGRVV